MKVESFPIKLPELPEASISGLPVSGLRELAVTADLVSRTTNCINKQESDQTSRCLGRGGIQNTPKCCDFKPGTMEVLRTGKFLRFAH